MAVKSRTCQSFASKGKRSNLEDETPLSSRSAPGTESNVRGSRGYSAEHYHGLPLNSPNETRQICTRCSTQPIQPWSYFLGAIAIYLPGNS
jgi:hypothetical protein